MGLLLSRPPSAPPTRGADVPLRFAALSVLMTLTLGCTAPPAGPSPTPTATPAEAAPPPVPASTEARRSAYQDAMAAAKQHREEVRGLHMDGRFRPAVYAGPKAEETALLKALGYVASHPSEVPDTLGATVHLPDEIEPGYRIVISGHAPTATLMREDGEVVHTWTAPFTQLFPDRDVDPAEEPSVGYFRRVIPLDEGHLIVVFGGLGIARIDRTGQAVWAKPFPAHHDAQLAPDGSLWTLSRRTVNLAPPDVPEPMEVVDDLVLHLDVATGEALGSWSLLDMVRTSPFAHVLENIRPGRDIFHANSIDVLTAETAAMHPVLAPGRVLLSMRSVNAVAVFDLQTSEVPWLFQGSFVGQHEARVTPSGRILLFDNQGTKPHSRALEIDPHTRQEHVVVAGADDAPLYSMLCGIARRLPRGGTMVVETDRGSAVEFTADGRRAWTYHNTHRGGPGNTYVASVFDVLILPFSEAGWLADMRRLERPSESNGDNP